MSKRSVFFVPQNITKPNKPLMYILQAILPQSEEENKDESGE